MYAGHKSFVTDTTGRYFLPTCILLSSLSTVSPKATALILIHSHLSCLLNTLCFQYHIKNSTEFEITEIFSCVFSQDFYSCMFYT